MNSTLQVPSPIAARFPIATIGVVARIPASPYEIAGTRIRLSRRVHMRPWPTVVHVWPRMHHHIGMSHDHRSRANPNNHGCMRLRGTYHRECHYQSQHRQQ